MINAYESIKVVSSLNPLSKNSTWNSTGVSVEGYNDCLICVHVGVGSSLASNVYYTLTFEESTTSISGGFSTIAAGDMEGGLSGTYVLNATTKDEQIIVRGYKGSGQWVRVTATLSGSDSGTTVFGVFVVLANPIHVPITPVTEV